MSVDAPTVWLRPRPTATRTASDATPRLSFPARSPLGTALDLAARVGTAVTLAALLIVTGTVVTMVDAGPVPTGAASTGR